MGHEIQESDSLFLSNNQPAWHNLGKVIVDPDCSTEDAIKHSGLGWKVKKIAIECPFEVESGKNKGQTLTAKSNQFYGVVRNTDLKILGIVEKRYKVFQNTECFEFMNSVAGPTGEIRWSTAGSLKGGKIVWMLGKLKNCTFETVPGDVVHNYVLLSTSHDGSMPVTIGSCDERVCCANTLRVAHNEIGTKGLRIRHTTLMATKVEEAQRVLGLAVANAELHKEMAQYLASLKVTQSDVSKFINYMIPIDEDKSEKSRSRGQNEQLELLKLIETGRGTNIRGVKGTAWGLLNSYTEYQNYSKSYRDTEESGSADNKLFSLWFGQGVGAAREAQDYLLGKSKKKSRKSEEELVDG